jgi:hypothetical protein
MAVYEPPVTLPQGLFPVRQVTSTREGSSGSAPKVTTPSGPFYRDSTTGAIYSVSPTGEMTHVTAAQWQQLKKENPKAATYTNYSFNPSDQSALNLLANTLNQWGLGSLVNDLKGLVIQGITSDDELSLALSQTDAYKQRFAGNELRAKAGLPELTPAQYIGLEEQYSNILNAYGLPKGFYDSHSDFTKLIGNDISPTELQTRAQIAHDQYEAAPDYVKNLWSQYFGTKGDAIAAILDPDTATQVIQDRANQVAIGGAAAQFGFGVNQQRAQQFEQSGVTLDQARKAYQQIAQSFATDQSIAQRFGTTFSQQQEENNLLLGDAQAGQKRQSLYDEEQALFKGGNSADQNTIGVSQSY